jgi:BioD-like phosphotransacetylase family protein
MVLTGGFRPPQRILGRLRESNLFTYLVARDTYATAQAVDELLVKTHSGDTEKIAEIIELVGGAVDVDRLLARLSLPARPARGQEERPQVGTRRPLGA